MDAISGKKYKLAAIEVYQKGTLVDVFAKFAKIEETLEDIMAPASSHKNTPAAKPGTLAAALEDLPPMPRRSTMPTLSVADIVEALVGKHDLQQTHEVLRFHDVAGVIEDLGRDKLAQTLVKMGEVRQKVLQEGQATFVPMLAPKKPMTP